MEKRNAGDFGMESIAVQIVGEMVSSWKASGLSSYKETGFGWRV